jgi:hypothetical protein
MTVLRAQPARRQIGQITGGGHGGFHFLAQLIADRAITQRPRYRCHRHPGGPGYILDAYRHFAIVFSQVVVILHQVKKLCKPLITRIIKD